MFHLLELGGRVLLLRGVQRAVVPRQVEHRQQRLQRLAPHGLGAVQQPAEHHTTGSAYATVEPQPLLPCATAEQHAGQGART